jgi:hypothetical protein
MMIRIAEAPPTDLENEGKTITPYFAAELAGMALEDFLGLCKTFGRFINNGYTFEVMKGKTK